MNPSSFRYVQLDRDRHEIRLLTLQTDSLDDDAKYSMSKASLKDDINFNALSYTWGSAPGKCPIIINDEVVEVTANLDSALRHLRYHEDRMAKAPLWVDAICINQSDNSERNHQVQMMKQIYRGASSVLVWLGSGNAYCDRVFQRCNDEKFLEEAEKAQSESLVPSDELLELAATLDRNLLRREWWNRMWVMQEIVLAKQDPLLICGRSFTIWKNFMKIVTSLRFISSSPIYWRTISEEIPRYSPTSEVQAYPEYWHRLREDYEKSGGLDLTVVFASSKFGKATDPRDHVYGCLGILKPEITSEIEVDYKRQPIEIYRDAVLTILRHNAQSYLRNCIILFPAHAPDPKFPSWVPFLAEGSAVEKWQHSSQALVVTAMKTLRVPQVSISDNLQKITVTGIKFDKISEAYSFNEVYNFDGRQLDQSIIQHVEVLAMEARKEPISESHTHYQFSWLRMYEDLLTIFTKIYNLGKITADERDILWSVLSGRTKESEVLQRVSGQETEEARWKRLFELLYDAAARKVGGRKFLVSATGFLGIGVPKIEKGDIIVYIFGMHCPLVVRAKEDGGGYVMVGFAYISGLSDIDLVKEWDGKGLFNHLETTLDIY